jgi:hypothetical protein
VDINVVVELSGVLITETCPCKFYQLYNILVSTFICSLVQRVKDEDLASRIHKLKRIQWKLSIDVEVLVS